MKEIIEKAEELFRNNPPESRKNEVYIPHVELVRKYALLLGKEYDADLTVLEIAALLHDIGADAGSVHAHRSAEIAEEFLSNKDVDEETKNKILSAIEHHSMPKGGEKYESDVTLEDQIIRDADGIAFLEDTYKGYLEKKLRKNPDRGKEISLEKINGMLGKVKTDKGKDIADRLYPKAKRYIKNFKGL